MSMFAPLLEFFKVLADENRLRMIGLLSEREYTVGELSAVLEITEPTTSHHLSKLRAAGLVTLRSDGTFRHYRLDERTLQRYKQAVMGLEQIRPPERPAPLADDHQWVDALGLDDESRKVLVDYTSGQRLKSIPTKLKKLQVVLAWLATRFETERLYSEAEVNAILREHHEDYARLRRELIEAGYLARERDGRHYWRLR